MHVIYFIFIATLGFYFNFLLNYRRLFSPVLSTQFPYVSPTPSWCFRYTFSFEIFICLLKMKSFFFFFRSRFHIWTLLMRSGDVRCQPIRTFFSIILLSDIIFLSLVFLLPQNFLYFFKMFHFFFFILFSPLFIRFIFISSLFIHFFVSFDFDFSVCLLCILSTTIFS